jgi:signal transduction histidine kinase
MHRREWSVRQRILFTNLLMLAFIFVAIAVINWILIKGYAGAMEDMVKQELGRIHSEEQLKQFAGELTIRSGSFYAVVLLDIGFCALAFFLISVFFTNHLTRRILYPLDLLQEGSERVRNKNLTEDIVYTGETEFVNVCGTFNEMQHSILEEKEQIRRYEKARTDMISGISHDLRTPLTAIQGTVKGLIDGVADTPQMQKKFLERAYERSREMDRMLEQLLLLSRMETGHIPVHAVEMNLEDFLRGFVSSVSETSGRQTVLEVCSAKEPVYISADPDWINRMLQNLLENSRKYSDKDLCVIHIFLQKNNDCAQITFADNGPGVPADKLPHLFDEFYRADESRNKVKGNGLGLYIVKSLTESMGGTVSAENADGLRITMSFPLCSAPLTGEENNYG